MYSIEISTGIFKYYLGGPPVSLQILRHSADVVGLLQSLLTHQEVPHIGSANKNSMNEHH